MVGAAENTTMALIDGKWKVGSAIALHLSISGIETYQVSIWRTISFKLTARRYNGITAKGKHRCRINLGTEMKAISPTKEPIKIGITLQCNPNPIGHFQTGIEMQSPNATINPIIRRQTIRIARKGQIMSKDLDNPDQTITQCAIINRSGWKGRYNRINPLNRKTAVERRINRFWRPYLFEKLLPIFTKLIDVP